MAKQERAERYKRYDLPTRVGMLEDEADSKDDKDARRWGYAVAILMMMAGTMFAVLADLILKVHP